jgi:hypothetical protein
VDGGHEGLLDVVLVVDGLDHGREAVGGAGRARDEVLAAVVLVGVGAHDDDLGVVLGGIRRDDLLGAAVDDGLGGLLGEEDARARRRSQRAPHPTSLGSRQREVCIFSPERMRKSPSTSTVPWAMPWPRAVPSHVKLLNRPDEGGRR